VTINIIFMFMPCENLINRNIIISGEKMAGRLGIWLPDSSLARFLADASPPLKGEPGPERITITASES